MSPNALASLIAGRLAALGMTQIDFAEAIRVEQGTVSRWLAGRIIPREKYVPVIAAVLQVDERDVWTARSVAQEQRLKESDQEAKAGKRELDRALERVGEFVKTYEAFHAAYRQMGDQIDALVGKFEKLAKDVADVKRDVRSLHRKEPR